MKKIILLIMMALVATGLAMAQVTQYPPPTPPPSVGAYGASWSPGQGPYTYANPVSPTTGAGDVLGAHNGYGRGCVMCHAPHSGSWGNGVAGSGDANNGMYALWGQDLTPLLGYSIGFSGDGNTGLNGTTASYPVTLPSNVTLGVHDANTVILLCLSCHDGVLTHVGMMQGSTVEALPIVGGHAPTLLGLAKPSGGPSYSNDHPVGVNAVVACNDAASGSYSSSHNWDCTFSSTAGITMNGTASGKFIQNYKGSFWNAKSKTPVATKLATFAGNGQVTGVTCTTCHDQHSMNVYTNAWGSWATMFFIKGQYKPYTNGNSVAQFCRNCHGGESNEMAGELDVPTI